MTAPSARRAPRSDLADVASDRPAPARRGAERRRRERHFRRRRRDLLEDGAIALVVAIVLFTLTAGLGVLALLEIPLAAILIASGILERRIRRRRKPARGRTHRSPSRAHSR